MCTNRKPTAMRSILTGTAVLTIILILPALVFAQTDYGDIRGIVFEPDSSGQAKPVAGVVVTLTRLTTGQTRTVTTDKSGRYLFAALEADTYTVSIPQNSKPVRLFPGDSVTQNLNITGVAALAVPTPTPSEFAPLKLNRGRVGMTLTASEIKQSPGRGLDGERLLVQAPGATIDADGGLTFNGISEEQTVFRVNGIDTGPLVFIPSSSAQENRGFVLGLKVPTRFSGFNDLAVDTSNYPVTLGTGTGGQISADIKRGSKPAQYAGDFYGFFNNDRFNARNPFEVSKPSFNFAQYGFQFGGPLVKDQIFFYVNYEGGRVRSGARSFEAIPSAQALTRAVPSIARLFPAFNQGGAQIVDDASSDPNFDIVELNSRNRVNKNGVAVHLNLIRIGHEANLIYLREQASEDFPEGVTGRRQIKRDVRQTGILRYQRTFGSNIQSETVFGVNSSPVRLGGRLSTTEDPDLSQATILIRGEVPQTGIEGQPGKLGIATPGTLLRKNNVFLGRGLLFTPYNIQLNEQVVMPRGANHVFTFGGGVRFLRTYMDVRPGITYTFANVEDFLQAKPFSVQYLGDLGTPSPIGATPGGERKAEQEYYILYGQHQWMLPRHVFLTYGMRYEYYSVLRESKDRAVVFDVDAGKLSPPGTPFYKPSKMNFAPRLALTWAPRNACTILNSKCEFAKDKVVLSASFGVYLGPSPFLDQAKPIESDRIIYVTQRGGVFPSNVNTLASDFLNNPDNRQYQPLALAPNYSNVERVYKYDVALKYPLFGNFSLLVSYIGNQGRNLLLRNFTNRISQVFTNADPAKDAVVIREFDVVNGNTILKPFGEIDFRTSEGKSNYNSFQTTVRGFHKKLFPLFEFQYSYADNRDNTNGGSKTVTTGNPFDYEYDWGYAPDDVRHKVSVKLFAGLPFGRGRRFLSEADGVLQRLTGNWTVAALTDFQTGRPIHVLLTRPDIVYVDGLGHVFSDPAAGRTAVINTPAGGSSLAQRRPDLVPGANPYLRNGLSFLNPEAFAIPAPGTFGNLKRGALRGPSLKVVDLVIRKQFLKGETSQAEFRIEVSNVFNWVNYDKPVALLPNALGTDSSKNQLQPGQQFSTLSAPGFGLINRTFRRDQDLGSSRQIRFGFIVNIGGGR